MAHGKGNLAVSEAVDIEDPYAEYTAEEHIDIKEAHQRLPVINIVLIHIKEKAEPDIHLTDKQKRISRNPVKFATKIA